MRRARIEVVEPAGRPRAGWLALEVGRDVQFSARPLEQYALRRWEPVLYDAMVLAAAVEFADVAVRRPHDWTRDFSVRVAVHEPERWRAPEVLDALHGALTFLTGDRWKFSFRKARRPCSVEEQEYLRLLPQTNAVLPFSDGMDSMAVAGVLGVSHGERLLKVRVCPSGANRRPATPSSDFVELPYRVNLGGRRVETSCRSRGFKFGLAAAIASYVTESGQVVMPESGVGVIGPALVPVGQALPDYRVHPRFTKRLEQFTEALLGTRNRFTFPRIWSTKGETLREFVETTGSSEWRGTRSCWKDGRWSSVNGTRRQCGICAACLLRRLAVHSAGCVEDEDTYVAVDLSASTLEEAVHGDFLHFNAAFQSYAIAAVRFLSCLADHHLESARPLLKRHASSLAHALAESQQEVLEHLSSLFQTHSKEWQAFLESLGHQSFVKKLAVGAYK